MAPRKKATPVVVEETGPRQDEIGHLLASSISLHGDKVLSKILENSENLDLSKDQIVKIQQLIKSCTSETVNSSLNQLISYY